MSRLSWSDYFMGIAHLVAERSTCLRKKVGAIAVKERRILATGYNGAPSKLPHASEVGCLRDQLGIPSGQRHEICRGLHAEQNIIIQAAIHAISLNNAEVYCTHQPCLICSKMLINCNITTIWYTIPYPDELAKKMLNEAGVELIQLTSKQNNSTFEFTSESSI
ncbi:cytidine/deoxycytidylate deaminase family protein [Lawsonia intracellularis]|uniref:deoxycytidylate deaminase n=1 Tax=Lawsonia intracellularis TaxID=29546 RepID=UPI0002ADBC1A|nr:cytidine/deoxycytidylate deaminase family protein [Lawsonia intracellularis]AGC49559.1 cytidine and deoxycytidylate deaminase zinc-binding protein [Lawsonia intracellularis N343]KAA0205081.1 cytidine deaminase [Lawsonia intracellularis]MBZ3892393.1 cytidine/deoxycytidylate deaminase family protein [Lawsonia intracellularis]OMQ06220.1 cytidine deaminase [Lawsonia intracellularis]RBN32371.1 cytidine deaminase [Lawsonia intracellularis]